MTRRTTLAAAGLLVLGAGTLAVALPPTAQRPASITGEVLLDDGFAGGAARPVLITNGYAYYHQFDPRSAVSSVWEMTSGSLFARRGRGWSGAPDLVVPDAASRRGTGSAVFRLRSRRSDFGNVELRARMRVLRWTNVLPGPLNDVVLWARYQSDRHLYLVDVLTARGDVSVAKKRPGGPSPQNGGTYVTLPPFGADRPSSVVLGRWYEVGLRVCTHADGSTSLTVLRDGRVLHRAVDRGAGQVVELSDTGERTRERHPPISDPGRVGIRGDDAEFEIDRFEVRSLSCARAAPTVDVGAGAAAG